MSDTLTLPVLALRETVLMPGITSPVAVGRRKSLRAVEAATNAEGEGAKLVFAVCQRQGQDEVDSNDLHAVGVVARIEQLQRGLAGVQLLVQGLHRGVCVRVEERDKMLVATIRKAEEDLPQRPEDPAFVGLYKELRERAADLGQKSGLPKEAVHQVLAGLENPGQLADLVAGYLDIPAEESQKLLEVFSVENRMRQVLVLVERQLRVLDAQEEIKSKVQAELGDRQREVLLREQMRAIQQELGDDDSADQDELREKLEALDLPADVRKEVDRELKRLGRLGRESMESQVVRTYLETISELPWSERSDDHLDLERAAEVLDEDHYGLEDVKDRVLEFLAVRQLRDHHEKQSAEEAEAEETDVAEEADAAAASEADVPPPATDPRRASNRSPILLFSGPPGVGKTSVAKSIARAMDRKYVRISLGGARDEADIRGHRRTYVAAMPGRILQGMKQAGTKNPVFLLDEIDKLGASFHGDPAAALLEVLDPAQNDSFTDHYLGVPFDLSEVMFIATANFLQNIPQPLLDRMEVVGFDGYTEREKLEIAKQYLVPRQLEANGFEEGQLAIEDAALSETVTSYTREAGVRQLEREIGKLCRKVARKAAAQLLHGEIEAVTIDRDQVRELLGRPKIHPEQAARRDQIGVATGMFYTPAGGDIIFVEASIMPGKGNLVLTGQLGDVMKESARAAWSYARSNAEALHIEKDGLADFDVHVHVPAGAIPKDGPSAGVAMATALVSTLSGRPARHDIAMTGEIALTGRVLPIGGVKEKVLGAVRAGITRFVLPRQNEADLEDLPQEVRDTIEVYPADELGEVLALTLRDASYREGRLLFGDDRPEDVAPLVQELPGGAGPH